jgi:hypothetical protein
VREDKKVIFMSPIASEFPLLHTEGYDPGSGI